MNDKITGLKTILLAEDDLGDVELILAALEEIQLADKVMVVKELGAFWARVNEPPLYDGEEEDLLQGRALSSPGKREVNDEIPAPHPALGG